MKVMEREERTLFLTLGVSLLCHVIFFGLMLFWPSQSPAIFKAPSAIVVDMVSLPAVPVTDVQPVSDPEPTAKPEPVDVPQPKPDEIEIKPPTPEPEVKIPEKSEPKVEIEEPEKIPDKPPKHIQAKVKPKPDKLPAKIVSLTPKKKKPAKETPKPKSKPKTALKQKTQKSSNIIKQAIANLEMSKKKASYDPVKAKLEGLRRKLGKIKETGAPKRSGGTYSGQSRGKFSLELASLLNRYKSKQLNNSISQNWAFNPGLAGGGADLEVQLLVKIMASGRIESIKVIKQSGNTMLDESAYRAIKKSDPLPPLPKGMPYYEIIMGFGPSGLN
jgi:colicin import membrane protein